MDSWDSSLRHDHNRHRHRRDNPSFSSSLLDAIYRSIDDGDGADHGQGQGQGQGEGEGEGEVIIYRETMRKKQSGSGLKEEEKMVNFRRACLIEKWMEKKVSEKVVVRRSSVADFDRKSRHHHHREIALLNSSSSSSESSSGGGFSSSESESLQRPKPIRTSVSALPALEKPQFEGYSRYGKYINNSAPIKHQIKPSKHESGFVKTKSKALKIYGDLKKVKQPISPGGRLASFLNSLFTAGNAKKAKIEDLRSTANPPQHLKSKSTNASTCSSASSFSRSCLSNTPSSRGKFSDGGGGTKRSVRFCPVSVIVDEDCRPCGHKSLHEDREPTLMALTAMRDSIDDRRRVQEVAIDLLKSYQKNNVNDTRNNVVDEFDMRDVVRGNDNAFDHENDDDDDDDEEYDDAASYSSSDLFELDNLSAIGIERYREELPVYETTHFDTNRAIANGLIL